MSNPAATTHTGTSVLFSPAFILLCVSTLCFFASYHLVSPVFPMYLKQAQITGVAVGSIVASFMLSSLLLRPFAGKWADETDNWRLMLVGIVVFSTCPLLYPLAQSELPLYAVRILHGLGFALFYTASSSLLSRLIPPHQKAEGISYWSNAIKLAMAFSPSLGLWLVARQPIQSAFWLASGFGFVSLAIVLALGPFARQQVATASPAGNKGKLFNRRAFFPGAMMACNSMAFGALIPFVPFLALEKHLDAAGWFYTTYAVLLILSRAVTGRWSDRYGRDAVVVPGMIMVVLALLMLSWSPNAWLFLIAAGLYGLSAGSVQPSLMALAVDRTTPETRGSAMATFTMMTDLGIALGSFLMGSLGSSAGYSGSLLWIALSVTAGCLLYVWHSREQSLPLPMPSATGGAISRG